MALDPERIDRMIATFESMMYTIEKILQMPSDVVSTVADAKNLAIAQNQDIAPSLELSADTYPDVLWSSPKAEIEVPLSMPIASGYVQGDVAIVLSEARILSSKGIEEVDTAQSFLTLPLLISNHVSAAIDISLTSAGLGDSSNNIRGKGGTSVAIETSSIKMLAELSPGCLSFPPAGYFTMHIVFPQYEENAIAHTPMLDHIILLNCEEINNGAQQIHEETVNTMPYYIASTEATSAQHRVFVASYVAEEEQDNQPHEVFSVTTTTNTMAAMQMPNQFLMEPTIDRDIGGQTSAILYDNPTCLYASAITESGSQQVHLSSYKACFLRHHGFLMPTQGPVVVMHMMCFDPGIFFDVWILHAVSRIVIVFLSWSKQREQVALALSVISRQDGALSRAPFLLGHILPNPGILGDVSLRTITALALTSLCLLQYCRPWPQSIHYRVPIFVVATLLAQNTTVSVLQQAPLAVSPVLARVIHIISTSYISLLSKIGVPHSRDPKVIANTFTIFLCLEISVTGYKILDADKSSFGWPLPTGFSVLGQSLCSDWHFTQGYYGGLWMQMATAARVPEARISLPTSPNLIGTIEFSVLMDVIQKLLQFLTIGQVSVIVEYIAVYPTSVFLLFVLMVRAGSIPWLPCLYCNSSYLRYFVLDSGLALMCTIVAMDNVHSLWHISLLAQAKFTWHITFRSTELARAIIVHGLVYPKISLDPFVIQALGVPQLAMIFDFCFAPRVISFVILLCVAISQYFGTMIAGLHYRHLVKFPVPFTASVQDHSSPGHPTMFVEFYFRGSLESITSMTNVTSIPYATGAYSSVLMLPLTASDQCSQHIEVVMRCNALRVQDYKIVPFLVLALLVLLRSRRCITLGTYTDCRVIGDDSPSIVGAKHSFTNVIPTQWTTACQDTNCFHMLYEWKAVQGSYAVSECGIQERHISLILWPVIVEQKDIVFSACLHCWFTLTNIFQFFIFLVRICFAQHTLVGMTVCNKQWTLRYKYMLNNSPKVTFYLPNRLWLPYGLSSAIFPIIAPSILSSRSQLVSNLALHWVCQTEFLFPGIVPPQLVTVMATS